MQCQFRIRVVASAIYFIINLCISGDAGAATPGVFLDSEAVKQTVLLSEAAYDNKRPLRVTLATLGGASWTPLGSGALSISSGKFDVNGYYVNKNAAGFVAVNGDYLAIVFRGTDQLPRDIKDAVGRQDIHYDLLLPLIKSVETYLSIPANAHISKIYVTGHSLGGAMAERFAELAILSRGVVDGKDVQIITFGSPGTKEEHLSGNLLDHVLRIVHTGDGVPKVDSVYGLVQPGREVSIDRPDVNGRFESGLPDRPIGVLKGIILTTNFWRNAEHKIELYGSSIRQLIGANVQQFSVRDAAVVVMGTGGGVINLATAATAQLVIGTGVANKMVGSAQNDVFYGGGGSDRMDARGGDDFLNGGKGGDVYGFSVDDGNDVINDAGGDGEVDVVEIFGAGIITSTASLRFLRLGNDLRIEVRDFTAAGHGSVTIRNMIDQASQVEKLRLFAGNGIAGKGRQIGPDIDLVRVFLEAGGSSAADAWARGYGFQRIPNPSPVAGEEFGREVTLAKDGGTLAAGENGAVYVFRTRLDQWLGDGKLMPSAATADDFFGDTFAIDAHGKAILGGVYRDDGAFTNQGLAVVFETNSTAWTETPIPPITPVANGNFGYRVGLADVGTLGVVSAIGETKAYIIGKDGTGWHAMAPALQPAYGGPSQFGWDVAMSGDGKTCLVSDFQQGIVTAFRSVPSGWAKYGELSVPGLGVNEFGFDLSLSEDGRTALVSRIGFEAYVFTDDGHGFTQAAKLVPSDAPASSSLGFNVDLSADGKLALVGAPTVDIGGISDAGAAYLFSAGNDGWTAVKHEIAKIVAPIASANAQFGIGVSLSGDGMFAAIGSFREAGTDGSVFAGAAYVVGPGVTN